MKTLSGTWHVKSVTAGRKNEHREHAGKNNLYGVYGTALARGGLRLGMQTGKPLRLDRANLLVW